MTKITLIIACLAFLISCNDGDVLVTELHFPETLQSCTGNEDLIIYTIKETPNESLSLRLPIANQAYFTTVNEEATATTETTELTSTYTFNYRSYSGDPSNIFCNSLPPTTPEITNNYVATDGTVEFTTTLIEDDNDGIPANLEDDNTDGDNNHLTNPRDTDNDGVYDYLDSDDDGDNVPTIDENPDPNGDGDLSDAQDTDNDGTPDYLDDDDDDDGTITRYEDTNGDNDPTTDITDPTIGHDYLNDQITTQVVSDVYRDHTKNENYNCIISISDTTLINSTTLEEIIYENYPLGTVITNRTVTYEVPYN